MADEDGCLFMKVLHTAFMVDPAPGIMHQMEWEQMAAEERGMDWDVRLFCRYTGTPRSKVVVPARKPGSRGTGVTSLLPDRLGLRRDYFHWLKAQTPRYDVILLRYSVSDPMQAAFVKGTDRPIYLVHHALEVPELRLYYKGLGRSIRISLERFFGGMTLRSANGIVAMTDEILRHEADRTGARHKQGYVYPNGIYYPDASAGHGLDGRGTLPEILFVASRFVGGIGLDRLLDSLAGSSSDFILHLVGTLNPEDEARAVQDHRIRLHGILSGSQIEVLSQKCWVGLSSFALDRKGMEQACTLKVREYLFHGLPVYANYRDVFPDDFRYYRIGPPDIDRILEYAALTRNATRAEVAAQARPFISKSVLLASLHEWLGKRVCGRGAQAPQCGTGAVA